MLEEAPVPVEARAATRETGMILFPPPPPRWWRREAVRVALAATFAGLAFAALVAVFVLARWGV